MTLYKYFISFNYKIKEIKKKDKESSSYGSCFIDFPFKIDDGDNLQHATDSVCHHLVKELEGKGILLDFCILSFNNTSSYERDVEKEMAEKEEAEKGEGTVE